MYSGNMPQYNMQNQSNTDQQNAMNGVNTAGMLAAGVAALPLAGAGINLAGASTSIASHYGQLLQNGAHPVEAAASVAKNFGMNAVGALEGMPGWGQVAAAIATGVLANKVLGNPVGGLIDNVAGTNFTGRQNLPGMDPSRSYGGSDRIYGDTMAPMNGGDMVNAAQQNAMWQDQNVTQPNLDRSIAMAREQNERARRTQMMNIDANQATDLLRNYNDASQQSNQALQTITNTRF